MIRALFLFTQPQHIQATWLFVFGLVVNFNETRPEYITRVFVNVVWVRGLMQNVYTSRCYKYHAQGMS